MKPGRKIIDRYYFPCGHPRTPGNIYKSACRECRRLRSEKYNRRNKDEPRAAPAPKPVEIPLVQSILSRSWHA